MKDYRTRFVSGNDQSVRYFGFGDSRKLVYVDSGMEHTFIFSKGNEESIVKKINETLGSSGNTIDSYVSGIIYAKLTFGEPEPELKLVV